MRLRTRPKDATARCPLCLEPLAEFSSLHTCDGCATRFHAECFAELGGCSTLGCERGARVEVRSGGALGQGRARRTEARAEDEADAFAWHDAVTVTPGEPRMRIDPNTFMESVWQGGAILAGFTSVVAGIEALGGRAPWAVVAGLVALTTILGLLCAFTDNYYVFDFERREVLYRRRFFTHESLRRVAGFDEVAGFSVNCKKHSTKSRSWWEYWVELILPNGETVALTDGQERGLVDANRLASQLAEALGAHYWKGRFERPMRIVVGPYGRVTVTHPEPRWWGPLVVVLGALVVSVVVFLIVTAVS